MSLDNASNSYRQILRSSSIMGGASAINYLVGLVRVKIVAVLLGPSGVGLISLYTSAVGMVGTVTGLGIASSGVREVAQAHGQDPETMARSILVLKRACWVTGLVGWLVSAALAPWLSQWIFGESGHALAIAVLGATLLLGALSGGQMAVIQGVRRIGDIARVNVLGVMINTVAAIGLYAWLGEEGILPVLVATAAITLATSWWFSRRIRLPEVALGWRETLATGRRLATLGSAFMWSGLMMAALDIFTRTLITRQEGVEAAGFYQAAWALSGLFAGFILSAMGTDFYPRLTGVIHDHDEAATMVNQQMEIGILLALPGLLATLALSPWLLQLFYSEAFQPGAELLPWFVLGIFGRIISWPLGFIQLALGASRAFAITETLFVLVHLGLVAWLVPRYGALGAAYGFALAYGAYVVMMTVTARWLIRFEYSKLTKQYFLASALAIVTGFVASQYPIGVTSTIIGLLLTIVSVAACIIIIIKKTDTKNLFNQLFSKRNTKNPTGNSL